MLAHTRHRAQAPRVHVGASSSAATPYVAGGAVIAVGAIAALALLKVSPIGALIVAAGTIGLASKAAYETA